MNAKTYEFETIIIAIWNIVVFAIYGLDKHRAKRHSWRTSEKMLLLAALFMGGMGALFGMYVFRHKTKHIKFIIGVPLLLIANIAIIVFWMKMMPPQWG